MGTLRAQIYEEFRLFVWNCLHKKPPEAKRARPKAQGALRKGFHCKALFSRLEVLLVVALGNIYHFDMRLSDIVFVAATFHIVPIPF